MLIFCALCGKRLEASQAWSKAKYCCKEHAAQHREALKKERAGRAQQVWACGGGVQSTAIAALIVMGKLPKPDLSWIVDVGWEPASTWKHVDEVLIPRLANIGVTLNILRTTDYVDNNPIDQSGHLRLPAYRVSLEGRRMKFDMHCSQGWKRRVANQWLRFQGVERCDTWLGISTDEIRRVRKSTLHWNQNRYPLVELGIDRGKCLYLLGKNGWPIPPRTSCYMCPNHSDAGWIELKRNAPEDFERAVQLEREIRTTQPDVFLHEFCQPLDQVVFRNQQQLMELECFGSDALCGAWAG